MELSLLSACTPKVPERSYTLEGYPLPQGLYEVIDASLEGYPEHEKYPDSATQSKNQSKSLHKTLQTAQPFSGAPNETSELPKRYSWWKDMRRNRPQPISLAASTVISMSAGMSLAWSFDLETQFENLSGSSLMHVRYCWFIAVIVGACIATILIEKITMRVFNIIASILVMVNGILFISVQENVLLAVLARYCDGIAFGMTVIPGIVAGSEKAVKRFRGFVLSFEQIGLGVGMTAYMSTTYFNTTNASYPNSAHGYLALIYGAATLGFTFTYTMESPISYLRKGKVGAIPTQCWLQNPRNVTNETYALLNENQRLLEEDIARGRAVNISIGLIPMVNLCIFRALVTLSMLLPIIYSWKDINAFHDPWEAYVFAAMRLIGVFIAIFTLDSVGRKGVSAASLLVGGGLLFGIRILFASGSSSDGPVLKKLENIGNIENIGKGLLMSNHILAGISAPASTCYLGEAFSISVKSYFVLVAIIFENIIQIIFCCLHSSYSASHSHEIHFQFLFLLGALQIIFAMFFFFEMPETKQTTLREALVKFVKVENTEASI